MTNRQYGATGEEAETSDTPASELYRTFLINYTTRVASKRVFDR